MNFIEFLGKILSKKLGISIYAAKGLLKLSIKDELGPFHPINKVNYTQLKIVINKSLVSRMKGLEVSNFEHIRRFLLNELAKNQSLITFEKI